MTTKTREDVLRAGLVRLRARLGTGLHLTEEISGEITRILQEAQEIPFIDLGLATHDAQKAVDILMDMASDHTIDAYDRERIEKAFHRVENVRVRLNPVRCAFTPPDAPAEPKPATFGNPPTKLLVVFREGGTREVRTPKALHELSILMNARNLAERIGAAMKKGPETPPSQNTIRDIRETLRRGNYAEAETMLSTLEAILLTQGTANVAPSTPEIEEEDLDAGAWNPNDDAGPQEISRAIYAHAREVRRLRMTITAGIIARDPDA